MKNQFMTIHQITSHCHETKPQISNQSMDSRQPIMDCVKRLFAQNQIKHIAKQRQRQTPFIQNNEHLKNNGTNIKGKTNTKENKHGK